MTGISASFHQAKPCGPTVTGFGKVSARMADRAVGAMARVLVLLETGCVPAYAVDLDADGVQ